jgi:hypothetical protein
MPGLVPGIQVFASSSKEDVDGRDKPGHDEEGRVGFVKTQRAAGTVSISLPV